MKHFYALLFSFFVLGTCLAESQQKDSLTVEEKMIQAEIFIDKGNYEDAIKIYEDLVTIDPESPTINFYLGFCYLNTTMDKDKATKYLKKSVASIPDSPERSNLKDKLRIKPEVLKSVPLEAQYYLARAYHVNYKFQEALDVFEDLMPKIPTKSDEFVKSVQKEIEECKNGIYYTKHRVEMEVYPMDTLNSEFTDHSPVVSADEKTIIFTSRRPSGDSDKKLYDGQYNEEVYISRKISGVWQKPELLKGNVNIEGENIATISLSTDGKQLYLYKDDKGLGNIYITKTDDGKNWSNPTKVEGINSKWKESHASLAADGQSLYFTSDRTKQGKFPRRKKVGNGGLDIFVSKLLPDGSWGEPKNLGTGINTIYDEEGVFVHPNGDLYFSSKGHKTMGGYDIFKCKPTEEGGWGEPENLGYPINTTDDDVFYAVSPNGLRAYYASDQRQLRSKGHADLFIIGFAEDNIYNMVAYNGTVKLETGAKPDSIIITVIDPETDEIVGIYRPDKDKGAYVMLLTPKDKYNVTYEREGFQTYFDTLAVSKGNTYINTRKMIPLKNVTLTLKRDSAEFGGTDTFEVSISNINFEYNKYQLNKTEGQKVFESLDLFAEYLKQKPGVKIEIHGHTCELGTDQYNMGLSKRRATFIRTYLEKKGVTKETFDMKFSGERDPIAISRNADGSLRKEGLSYNRRVEFAILEKGNAKIQIVQVNVPENLRINKAKKTN